MENKTTNKNADVEILRGLAITLVVVGHVIGCASDGGMKVRDDSFYRYFYDLFNNFKLPLYTAIAGWVYALRPVKAGNIGSFLGKKVKRVLLPMVCVGTLYFMIQYFMPGTNLKGDLSEIWKIYIFPYTFFWYLLSIFLVFLVVALMDMVKIIDKFSVWLPITIFAAALSLIERSVIPVDVVNYFSFKGAMFLFPYFLIGMGVQRFNNKLCTSAMVKVWLFGLVGGVILQQLQWFGVIDNPLVNYSLRIIIGMVSALFLLNLKYSNKWLIYIGSYAYTIYLFHGFGTSGGRIILSRLHVDSSVAVFFLSLVLGLVIPIIVDKVLSKNRVASRLFLGK